ncbi:RYamide receptor-like [Haliotis rufescens]|uniref:RYamide receptor-like n=1 Tax=Haliotis rufescens TaxID=6454 RepID=UPI00201F1B6E|nr:RYamide receptor-like [Haliotis rufescens]
MPLGNLEIVFIVVTGVVLLFSVCSNILVIVLVIKNPKLRNVTNLFICNLAISDILLAGIVLPQNLHDVSHPTDYYEGVVLCKITNSMPIFCIVVSIYSLVAISCERRKAILLRVEPERPGHAALKIIPVIWTGAAVVIIPTVIEYSVYISVSDDNNISATSCASVTFSSAASISNGFVLLLTAYIIPLIFILGNYLRILNFLREHGLCDGSRRRKSTPRGFFIYRHRVKIVKMLILVAALFAISWLPYFILLISQKISGRDDHMFVGGPINMIKISLASFSTAYNVVLYAIYNRNFRGAFKKMFYNHKTVVDGTDLGCNRSHSRSSTSLPLAARPPIVSQM